MQHIRGVNGPINGKFRVAAFTGLTTGIAANGAIFSMRLAGTGFYRAVVTDLRLKAQIITPFTAANEISAAAYLVRSFTASDSGGTSLLPAGLNNYISSVDPPFTTTVTDLRVATTGALTAGTRTIDAAPILFLPAAQIQATASAAQGYFETALSPTSDQRFGLNLQGATGGTAANAEGLIVTLPVAQGAGGTVRYAIEIEWVEYTTNSAESIS